MSRIPDPPPSWLTLNETDDDHAVVHWLAPVTDAEYATAPPVA